MSHEDAAFEVGFGEDVGEGGGVVDVKTGRVSVLWCSCCPRTWWQLGWKREVGFYVHRRILLAQAQIVIVGSNVHILGNVLY